MSSHLDNGFRVGEWEVHPKQSAIKNADGEVHLEHKVMSVLVLLAEHADETVTRNLLLEEVWQGTYVTEDVISRSISLLRQHFKDDPHHPTYIQTIPKSGYRLIKPVLPLAEPEAAIIDDPLSPAPPRRWSWRARAAAGAVLLLLLAMGGYIFFDASYNGSSNLARDQQASSQHRLSSVAIAVIPFENLSENRDQSYISDGLSDELIVALSKVGQLKVVSRSTSFLIKSQKQDPRALGEELQVDLILEGSVRAQDDRVRVVAQLSRTADGFEVWSNAFDSELSDIFKLQNTISQAIVRELSAKLGLALDSTPSLSSTQNTEAYHLYLRGNVMWKKRGESAIRRSIELYNESLAKDPEFARAHLGLANAFALLPWYSNVEQQPYLELASKQLEKALQLDPSLLGEALTTRALLEFSRWEWARAEQYFQEALDISPNYTTLHNWYSQFSFAVNYKIRALEHAKRARDLDAVSPVINDRLAAAFLWVDDNQNAERQYRIGSELGFMGKRDASSYLLWLLREGRIRTAAEVLQQMLDKQGLTSSWVQHLGDTLQTNSNREQTIQVLVDAQNQGVITPRLLLPIWVLLADYDHAFALLGKLVAQKNQLDVEFLFSGEASGLREDPRFATIIRQLGLDRYWDQYGWPEGINRS